MERAILILLVATSFDGLSSPPPRRNELLDIADLAYKQRRTEIQSRRALNLYRDLRERYPTDVGIAWRLSMACHFFGMRHAKSDTQRKEIFSEGTEAGKYSLRLDAYCAPCHFWTAINMALYGREAGVLNSLFSLAEIREHLEQTIALEATYAYCGAFRLQALIERALPGILGGSHKQAIRYLQEAVEKCPDEPLNYLVLAELSIEMEDESTAANWIRRGLDQSRPTTERVESLDAYLELRELAAHRNVALR